MAEKLKHEIETGEYQPNDQLPKEFDLARSYNVSRITVRNAMKELESQGLIYRIQGAGTYVKERNLMHATVDSNQLELINLKKYKLKLLDFEVG
ncbi:GntR family transcriptional regulator [Lactobacillus amylovorus]|nr:GntR family transcriptional regulator [Lactobacillus amylovorus]MDB6226705.1 GntR family transcriptional regulator [Lactobacillus amylovorus]